MPVRARTLAAAILFALGTAVAIYVATSHEMLETRTLRQNTTHTRPVAHPARGTAPTPAV